METQKAKELRDKLQEDILSLIQKFAEECYYKGSEDGYKEAIEKLSEKFYKD